MKPLRVVYVLVIVAALGTAGLFYYQYRLRDRELAQYQSLSELFNEAFERVNAKLDQTKKEIEQSSNEVARLNEVIETLKRNKVGFTDEKHLLEGEHRSIEELKRIIEVARIQLRKARKIERTQRRLVKIEMLRALDEVALSQGNRGYLVGDCKTTFRPTRVKVELEPANKMSVK